MDRIARFVVSGRRAQVSSCGRHLPVTPASGEVGNPERRPCASSGEVAQRLGWPPPRRRLVRADLGPAARTTQTATSGEVGHPLLRPWPTSGEVAHRRARASAGSGEVGTSLADRGSLLEKWRTSASGRQQVLEKWGTHGAGRARVLEEWPHRTIGSLSRSNARNHPDEGRISVASRRILQGLASRRQQTLTL
jgi:hypothetical protein